MDDIASRAGVGVGTLYRHFPGGKAELVEAVVLDRLAKFVSRAEQLREGGDACVALFTMVRELARLAVQKKDLTEELARSGVCADELAVPARRQLEEILRGLWERAQADGKVRRDLDFSDLSSLIMATCVAADRQGQPSVDRLVGVVCDGLRDGVGRAGAEGYGASS